MSGFENPMNAMGKKSETKNKNLEKETLHAIRGGLAMPLPDFLENSSEARKAFIEALQQSNKLKKSIDLLTPEERLEFIKVFCDALDKENVSILRVGLGAAGGSIAVSGAILGTMNNDAMLVALTVASGLLTSLGSIMASVQDNNEREKVKKLIRSAVGA